MTDIYGDLAQRADVVATFAGFLADLGARGTRAVLTDFLKG
jgi:hypothetical protein